MKFCKIFLSLIICFGCVTTYTEPLSPKEATLESISVELEEERYGAGYLSAVRLRNRGIISAPEFDQIRSRVLDSLYDLYEQKRSTGSRAGDDIERTIRYILHDEDVADQFEEYNAENGDFLGEDTTPLLHRARVLAEHPYLEGIETLSDTDIEVLIPKENYCYSELYLETIGAELNKRSIPYSEITACDVDQHIEALALVYVDLGVTIRDNYLVPDASVGSAYFIHEDGYLLTNYHVIKSEVDPSYEGVSRVYISRKFDLSERIPVKVIAYDVDLDIALIKAEISAPMSLFPYPSIRAKRGSNVLSYGAPSGIPQTVTSGIISATNRERVLPFTDVLQFDAFTSGGSSGGAILDESGNFVGMTFAGILDSAGLPSGGLNLAIPSETISLILPRLLEEEGKHDKPWFGMIAEFREEDMVVAYVVPNSPAQKTGIEKGMRIQSINGLEVKSVAQIQKELLKHQYVDGLYEIELLTEDEEGISLLLASEARPSDQNEIFMRDIAPSFFGVFLGLDLETIALKRGLRSGEFRVTNTYANTYANISLNHFSFRRGDLILLHNWQYTKDDTLFMEFTHQGALPRYPQRYYFEIPLYVDSML